MIRKCFETIFRHKRLLLLPPTLIPLLVAPIAVLTGPVYYETWAGVWIDRPTYLTDKSVSDQDRYTSAAQVQTDRLKETLRTRAFQVEVANRVGLGGLVGSVKGEEQLRRIFQDDVSLVADGNHLLTLRAHAPTAQLSYDLLGAVLTTFKERAASSQLDEAGVAISFYEDRAAAADQQLAKSNQELGRYLAAHPDLARSAGPGAGPPLDPQLAELQQRVQFDQNEDQRVRTALEQARLDASASLQGQDLGFQVVDQPQRPVALTRELKKPLLFTAAGLLAGLVLSAVLLVLLMAGDRTVQTEADLPAGMPVLGSLPRLRAPRKTWPTGAPFARRAIGGPAGAPLPQTGGAR